MAEEKPKAPKKRATRKAATKRAPRKTAARKSVSTRTRKAPTKVVDSRAQSASASQGGRRGHSLLIALAAMIVVVSGSVWVGYSDAGVINIDAVLAEQNSVQSGADDVGSGTNQVTVPVKDVRAKRPNGGLSGLGAPKPVPKSEPAATSTASTTETTATSTDSEALEEEVEEEVLPPDELEVSDSEVVTASTTDTI